MNPVKKGCRKARVLHRVRWRKQLNAGKRAGTWSPAPTALLTFPIASDGAEHRTAHALGDTVATNKSYLQHAGRWAAPAAKPSETTQANSMEMAANK